MSSNTPKTTGTVKVPKFDKENFNLWKIKMMLFIKASHPLYPEILKNGPFVPQQEIPEKTVGTITIPRAYEAKIGRAHV